jgi:hypothetical protein
MNGTFFYIGLGLGLAAACGLRPFLPVLLAGALASGKALSVTFAHGGFHFLQASWWLLAVVVALVLAYVAQLAPRPASRGRMDPLGASVAGLAYGSGALLFAGTLAAHGDAWWPGLVGGLAAAALADGAVGPLIARARGRLPDRAAREAVTLYLDGMALLAAALVAALHPLGYVLVAVLAWLWLRGRARAGERYAGLRILGR